MANKEQEHNNLENVEQALTKTEQFIEDKRKPLTYIVLGIVLVVVLFLAFQHFYIAPLEKEAQSNMFVAEQYFEKDSFNLAINGDGNYLGFLNIIDEYSLTKSANLAKYYTGISYLHLGEYENAIDYLKKFKSKDIMIGSVALGAIGDAYSELNKLDEAISYYEKAANRKSNNFTSPIYLKKAAMLYELQNNNEDALELYEKIKNDYSESQEGKNAEKYIAKIKAKLKK